VVSRNSTAELYGIFLEQVELLHRRSVVNVQNEVAKQNYVYYILKGNLHNLEEFHSNLSRRSSLLSSLSTTSSSAFCDIWQL
jgi:hypothetical protein